MSSPGRIPLPDRAHCDGAPMHVDVVAWEADELGSTLRAGWRCDGCGAIVPLELRHDAPAEPRAGVAGVSIATAVRTGGAARRGIRMLAGRELAGVDARTSEERQRARDVLETLRTRLKEVGYTRHDEIDGEIDTMLAELDAADRRESAGR